jgi:hypothetical protein
MMATLRIGALIGRRLPCSFEKKSPAILKAPKGLICDH